MSKAFFTALFGALILAGPVAAREDVAELKVKAHNDGEGGAVTGCELTYLFIDETDDGGLASAQGGSLSVLRSSHGGRIVGLKISVYDGVDLRAPERAWIRAGDRDNRAEYSGVVDTEKSFSLFAYGYGPVSTAAIEGFADSGRVDVSYGLRGGEPGSFAIASDDADLRRDWATCLAALPPG